MTLEGIGSFSEASSATAIGLFTDSQFSGLPYGGDPIGTPYDLATTTALIRFYSAGIFLRQIFLMAMHTQLSNFLIFPESGVDQVISQKIGFIYIGLVFSTDEVTNWVHHHHLGWLYIEGSNPDGFWIYLPIFDSWAFTGSSLFPMFWLHSEQNWLFITLNEDQSTVTQSFDANTQVWTAFETP